MIENIIRVVMDFFSRVSEFMNNSAEDYRVQKEMSKNLINQTKVNASSIINMSMSSHSHVNFFRVTIYTEFLKIIALTIPYERNTEDGFLYSYLVRKVKKTRIEYIGFKKTSKDDTNPEVFFTYKDLLFSPNGIIKKYGKIEDPGFRISSEVVLGLTQSLSTKSSPFYQTTVLPTSVMIGDCWYVVNMQKRYMKIIMSKVIQYVKDLQSGNITNTVSTINSAISKGGVHLVMSFCKAYDDSFFSHVFSSTIEQNINNIVTLYNKNDYNKNKIISISYDNDRVNQKLLIETNLKNQTVITISGLTIIVTGTVKQNMDTYRKLNESLTDVIRKHNNIAIRNNFIIFLISIIGIGSRSLTLTIEESTVQGEEDNVAFEAFNKKISPVIERQMTEDGFVEDTETGLLTSTKVDTMLLHASNSEKEIPQVSKEVPISLTKTDTPVICKPIQELKAEIKEPIKTPVVSTNTVIQGNNCGSAIDALKTTVVNTEITEADSEYQIGSDVSKWTKDNCIDVLRGQLTFDKDKITQEDIIARLLECGKEQGGI